MIIKYLSWIFAILGVAYIFSGLLPQAVGIKIGTIEGSSTALDITLIISGAVYLVSAYGLYKFKSWALYLVTAFFVFEFIVTNFLISGAEGFSSGSLYSLILPVIVLAYLWSKRNQFNN